MRHHYRLADSLDVVPLLTALAAKPDLWNENPLRTTFPGSPHAAVDDIWVMFDDPTGDVVNSIQTHPCRAWSDLPVRGIVLDLLRRVNGTQLGRVIVTRLPPGKSIPEHVDQGAPAEFYTRFHIILQSRPGCLTYSGGEVIQASAGEVWWLDNRAPHSVVNNSDDDRIVIVVDIRVC